MNIRHARLGLAVLCGGLAVATLAVGSLALLLPLSVALPLEQSSVASQPATASAPAPGRGRTSIPDVASVFGRDLRKPLLDATAAAQTPAPTITFVLAGTIMEDNSANGIFRMKNGETRIVSVGERIEGAEIVEITADSATVRAGAQTLVLKVKKEAGP